MSADNWGICPKCIRRHDDQRAVLEQRLEDDYGKVSREDYKRLEQDVADFPLDHEKTELREDYEFVLFDDGTFYAKYVARCQNDECDFEFTFKHQEDVKV